jgi:leucyl aminopeptidase
MAGQGNAPVIETLPPRSRVSVARGPALPSAALLERTDALVLVVGARDTARLRALPHGEELAREHERAPRSPGAVWSSVLPTRTRTRVHVGQLAPDATPFQALALAGRLAKELAVHQPGTIALAAPSPQPRMPLEALLAATLAACEAQPTLKRSATAPWTARRVVVCGEADVARVQAVESGAHLARWLTALPPNVLTPKSYRAALATHARRRGWRVVTYDEAELAKAGAGAFLAVVRGSAARDAAIVKLEYRPRAARAAGGRARAPIALVGKGLCFDTGGTNLKTAKSMLDMHGDMGGSAVAVGLLDALTQLRFPHPVDAWLAIAENRIGSRAYTQNEVVTAANGTTIQVMHTDAEGRMVLADTLALAARTRPALVLDFATLTGACVAALTERYSGVFTNRPALRAPIESAGHDSGERVWTFPMPDDYDEELETPLADVLQCLIDGKGDHIYAARFLGRFVGDDVPWVHVDLSSAHRTGGLAHVSRPVTGFGVRFGAALLLDRHAEVVRPARATRLPRGTRP